MNAEYVRHKAGTLLMLIETPGGRERARTRPAIVDEASDSGPRTLVYATLKRIASGQLRRERQGATLDATSLVHEAYLRLSGTVAVDWRDRNHFFAIAAIAMRRILVDRARARAAQKRDAGDFLVTHSGAEGPLTAEEMLDLDRALEKLQAEEPRLARVVEMR